MKAILFFLLFMLLMSHLRGRCHVRYHKALPLCFLLRVFYSFSSCRCLMHFEQTVVQGIKDPTLLSCKWISSFPNSTCWKAQFSFKLVSQPGITKQLPWSHWRAKSLTVWFLFQIICVRGPKIMMRSRAPPSSVGYCPHFGSRSWHSFISHFTSTTRGACVSEMNASNLMWVQPEVGEKSRSAYNLI